jgi:hypothetical protein
MAHDLSRGNLRAAARDNLFLLLLAPLLAVMLRSELLARAEGRSRRSRERQYRAVAAAALAWMVVRNTPAWPLRPRSAESPRR